MLSPASYDILDVPATGDNGSRFALPSSPAGHAANPDEVIAGVYTHLIVRLQEQAQDLAPSKASISLKKVVQDDSGQYVLAPRCELTGTPTKASARPGSYGKLKLSGAALIDDLLLGGEEGQKANDEQINAALLQMHEDLQPHGRQSRTIQDCVAAALALRVGLVVRPYDIPFHPTAA